MSGLHLRGQYIPIAFLFMCLTISTASDNPVSEKLMKTTSRAHLSKSEITSLSMKLKPFVAPLTRKPVQNNDTLLRKALVSYRATPSTVVNSPQKAQNFTCIIDSSNGTPRFVKIDSRGGTLAKKRSVSDLSQEALLYINDNRKLFKIDSPSSELITKSTKTDGNGYTHICFAQYLHNLPVFGKEITFHFKPEGDLYTINANYSPTPVITNIAFIDSAAAISKSMQELQKITRFTVISDQYRKLLGYDTPKAEKVIWIDPITNKAFLSWSVKIRPNARDCWQIVVDAHDGNILNKYNRTPTEGPAIATAIDACGKLKIINVYETDTASYMIDASRAIWIPYQSNIINDPKGAVWTVDYRAILFDRFSDGNIISLDNKWIDTVSVSAHSHTGTTFQYFFDTFKRHGIDNSGSSIISVIHWPGDDGGAYDNAFWSGSFIAYGDGVSCKPFASGLDITAHEITHGIVQYTVDLEYQFQSGALNESFADIFAVMIDRDDWLLGEDVSRAGAFRSMENPNTYGQPSHMNSYVNLDINTDNGGVHYNSGIPNRACYLIARDLGRNKTEQIFYRILDAHYLNRQSQFTDLRLAAVRSAQDLFGDSSLEVITVQHAFDSVGIIIDSTPVHITPPVAGTSWVTAIRSTDMTLALIPTDRNPEFSMISPTPGYRKSANPYCISRNGTSYIFVDQRNKLRAVDFTTQSESIINSDGIWSSLALSPDESIIAATTIYSDSAIYLINSHEPSNCKIFPLNTQDSSDSVRIMYADAIRWHPNGQYIIFDCYCKKSTPDETLTYWNIGIADLLRDEIILVFDNPIKAERCSFTNPSFSIIEQNRFLYEFKNFTKNIYQIRIFDLITRKDMALFNNDNYYCFPSFSQNDSAVVYQHIGSSNLPELWKYSLTSGNADAQPELFVSGFTRPSWLLTGTVACKNPSEQSSSKHLLSGTLFRINHSSVILAFSLKDRAYLSIEVFDLNGRTVSNLRKTDLNPGRHEIPILNSSSLQKKLADGLYLCRIKAEYSTGREIKTLKMQNIHR